MRRLLRDEKTPRRVKALIAMYVIDRRLGKPTIAIGGVDGQPLVPAALPANSPLAKLFDRARALRAAQATAVPCDPTAALNAPPAASGAATKGPPS